MAIFKTEALKEKGLTQEQIDYIMAEAGKQVNFPDGGEGRL